DGPYALQAALAACHARALRPEQTDWRHIARLYDRLAQTMPSPVVGLNRAMAYSMAFGADAGLAQLDTIAAHPALRHYAPLRAARADMLARAGRKREARMAFEEAARLTRNSRERAWLSGRARDCGNGGSGPDLA